MDSLSFLMGSHSASCLAAVGSCDTRGARSVFSDAHVVRKNDQNHFASADAK